MARFDSSVGMVSQATVMSYPHPANSTVGEYPGFNEVLLSPTSQLSGSLYPARFLKLNFDHTSSFQEGIHLEEGISGITSHPL